MLSESRFLSATVSWCMCVGCGAVDDFGGHDEIDSTASRIVSGRRDSGHPAVGLLQPGCTGTLIGSRDVLTAGHCVDTAPTGFVVGGRTYRLSRIMRHSGYVSGNRNDLALVRLEQAPGVTPSPIHTGRLSPGTRITLVGFGRTSEGGSGFGTKRMGTASISSVGSTTFSFDGAGGGSSNVCNGDSGGPSYVTLSNGVEAVAGVHSTKTAFCGYRGTDMRVDAYVDWIERNTGGDVVVGDGTADPGSGGGGYGSRPQCSSDGCFLGEDPDVGLSKCQGDCDRDSDCTGELECFQRSGTEVVPGCDVGGQYRTEDFCYDPNDESGSENKSCLGGKWQHGECNDNGTRRCKNGEMVGDDTCG